MTIVLSLHSEMYKHPIDECMLSHLGNAIQDNSQKWRQELYRHANVVGYFGNEEYSTSHELENKIGF